MLTGVVIFLLVLIGLVAVPISLNFDINWHKNFYNDIQLRWMFGLVRVQIPTKSNKPQISKPTSSIDKEIKRARNGPPISKLILQKRFRQRLLKYIADLWRAISKENVRVHIRAGLDDPADTGQLWAVVGPISGILATAQQTLISIEPDFIKPGFEFNTSGLIRFSPLKILCISIGLMFSPAIWQGFQQIRATR